MAAIPYLSESLNAGNPGIGKIKMTTCRKTQDLPQDKNGFKNNPTFYGVYRAPIDKCGPPGRLARHQLLQSIVAGTPFLLSVQKYRRPWLDKIMMVLSFLGTEEFYTPVVVLLGWVIDTRMARLFVILMGIGFYFTTASKNFLRLPRPPCPPVQVLEKTYDWSLPSLHSVIGVMLPWYIFLYMLQHSYLPVPVEVLMLIVCISWSTSVSISRLYLGVHSPADVIAGLIPGVVLLLLFLTLDDWIYSCISSSSHWVMPIVFAFYASILILHPTSSPPTKSYGETVITSSVAFGFILAHQRTLGADQVYYESLLDQAAAAGVSPAASRIVLLGAARILVGFPLVLLTRLVMKPTMKFIVRKICGAVGVKCYYYPDYRKLTYQLSKHYTPDFKIPPIWAKAKDDSLTSNGHTCISETYGSNGHSVTNGTSKNKETELSDANYYTVILRHGGALPLDIDVPTKFGTYTTMSWIAMELIPHLYHALGLVI